MTLYSKFKSLDIDFSEIGLIQRDGCEGYFCTPRGSKIIGWAGVDGIHYCFIGGYGETVFAVSPMNGGEDNVHPLARNFRDFLRLLLACRDLAAMEQAWQWSRERFESYVEEIELSEKKMQIFDVLRNTLSITPMEDPYACIKELQSGFDYKSIPYTKEYYETTGEPFPDETSEEEDAWRVYYEPSFRGKHHGRDRAGEEILLNKQFAWGDEIWHIPALYSCGSGLVIDFCIEIQPGDIWNFMDKWKLYSEEDGEALSYDERIRAEQENPLNTRFSAILTVNGRIMRQKRGCALSYIPPELLAPGTVNSDEAEEILVHYGLDQSKGWSIHRISFPWATKKKPVLRSVKLNLEPGIVHLFGSPFTSPAVGEQIRFSHPITGVEHTLTVEEYTRQEMNRENLPGQEHMEFPGHFTMMVYSLTPELPDRSFSVKDCACNDQPRKKTNPDSAVFSGACMGIIGGADGPTAILFTAKKPADKPHAACSALHFEPVDEVTWRPVFCEKLRKDAETELM